MHSKSSMELLLGSFVCVRGDVWLTCAGPLAFLAAEALRLLCKYCLQARLIVGGAAPLENGLWHTGPGAGRRTAGIGIQGGVKLGIKDNWCSVLAH